MAMVSTWRENDACVAMTPTHTENGRTQWIIMGGEEHESRDDRPARVVTVKSPMLPRNTEARTSSDRPSQTARHMRAALMKTYLFRMSVAALPSFSCPRPAMSTPQGGRTGRSRSAAMRSGSGAGRPP